MPTTTTRVHRVGIALAIACVMGVMLAVFGASGALAEKKQEHPQRPADRVRALVLGKAQSPVLDELKRNQGWQLSHAASAQGRGNAPSKYDVLVVDGDSLSPQQLGSGTLVDEFADAHGWVLALDASPADLTQGLVDHTGFTVNERNSKSSMFLFSRQMVSAHPHVLMVEAQSLRPLGTGNLDQQELSQAIVRQTQEIASSATRAVRDDRCPNTGPEPAPQGEGDVPSDAQHIQYAYCEIGSQVTPPGYWKNPGSNYLDLFTEIIVPPPGTQTASWTLNHYFDVYLDNAHRPQGNFQYVTYRLNGGEFTPKKPEEKFFQMYDQFLLQHGSEHPYEIIQAERAWWTQQLGVEVTPDAQTDSKLIHQQSAPETPNEETEYSDEQSFHLGFSASEDGAEVSEDFDVKTGQNRTVHDWGVENDGFGNRLDWLFSARHPCDIRDNRNYLDCFGKFPTDGAPLEPNELSRTKLPAYAAGRWRTPKVLSAGEEGKATFAVKTPIVLADSRCETFIFGCDQRSVVKTTVGPKEASYSFDIGAVNPIPINSLTLSPNPANGTRHDKVTGTVTLQRPALMDTTVTIYSNSENATVGVPKPSGISSKTITIPKGSTSGTFEVLTNDNKLSPGQHTTATFTAFYTTSFQSPQSQLTVVAQKKGASKP